MPEYCAICFLFTLKRDAFFHKIALTAFANKEQMSEEGLDKFIAEIERKNPSVEFCYYDYWDHIA